MSIETSFHDYEHPIGPVGISTPEALGTMPHRVLRFPSEHARDAFLSRAMEPLRGPTDSDFQVKEAPANGGKYEMFFSKEKNKVTIRAWTRDPQANPELDDFIVDKLG